MVPATGALMKQMSKTFMSATSGASSNGGVDNLAMQEKE